MILNRPHLPALLVAPALLFAAAPIASANLLTNPSFETPDASGGDVPAGDWTDWEKVSGAAGQYAITDDIAARTGDQVLRIQAPTGTNFAMVRQTVAVTAGELYKFSAYVFNSSATPLAADYITNINIFFTDINGQQIDSFASGSFDSTTLPQDAWTLLSTQGVAPVGSVAAQLRITVRKPGGGGSTSDNRILYFDDASFTLVPEPASGGLALLGLGGLAMLSRRRV